MIQFSIDTEYIEMVKLLKAANLCSTGGEAKIAVISGMVTYNGAVDTRKRLKVRPGDVVAYNGQQVKVVG